MPTHIERLESRSLMSTTDFSAAGADFAKLLSDGQAAKASFLQYLPTLTADVAAVRTDLVGSGARNVALSAKLHATEVRVYLVLKAGVSALGIAEAGVARRTIADGLRSLAHPTNKVLQARVSSDVANFSTIGTVVLARFAGPAAAASAEAAADLAAISAANGSNTSLATHINAVKTDGAAFVSAMQTNIQTLQADLTTLVNDISTIV
jgi:hypothetical protein